MRDKYQGLVTSLKQKLSYLIDLARMEFTDDLDRLMKEEGVSRAELARRIGSSRAYVTKVLGSNTNFRLATMAKLARSMNAVLHIRLAREGEIVKIEQPETETPTMVLGDDYKALLRSPRVVLPLSASFVYIIGATNNTEFYRPSHTDQVN